MILYTLFISLAFSQAGIVLPNQGMDPASAAIYAQKFEMPEAEDLMEMGLLPGQGGMPGQAGSPYMPGQAGSPYMPGPYMNNPYGLPYKKCMDNDLCSQYVTMQALMPKNENGTASGSFFRPQSAQPQAGGSLPAGAMPRMPGMLPLGFHPEMYGLDPDAQMKDCADEASCMQGLAAFNAAKRQQGADPSASASAPQIPFFFPSVLAAPRPQYVLRQPNYNMPQYYLRAPRPQYNSRASYGTPHFYGYQPVYYYPIYY